MIESWHAYASAPRWWRSCSGPTRWRWLPRPRPRRRSSRRRRHPRSPLALKSAVELARARFETRDLAGVLASVSEQYRSNGMTKAAVRDQLNGMFALYQQLRARVTVDRVEMVGEGAWIYTTGEVSGRLPFVGWVTVLTWQAEPEVARREATGWRLFGFQD